MNQEKIEKYEDSVIRTFLYDVNRKKDDEIYLTSMENAKWLANNLRKNLQYIEQLEQEKKLLQKTNKEQEDLICDTYINYNDLEFNRLKKRVEQLENKVKEQEERINLSITIHEIKNIYNKEVDDYYFTEREATINERKIDEGLRQLMLGRLEGMQEIVNVINERRERNLTGGK